MDPVFEYRGVEGLVYTEILEDSEEKYETGEVKSLAAVAEIGKNTSTDSSVKYYDNMAMIVVASEGADDFTLTTSILALEKQADITGKTFDEETGAMIETPREQKYYAIGYKTKGTDGKYRYVWRHKGTFGIPEETVTTEDDGTESTNMQIPFTGIYTTHKFDVKGEKKGIKAIVIDERHPNANLNGFFDSVMTPENLKAKSTTETQTSNQA